MRVDVDGGSSVNSNSTVCYPRPTAPPRRATDGLRNEDSLPEEYASRRVSLMRIAIRSTVVDGNLVQLPDRPISNLDGPGDDGVCGGRGDAGSTD